MVEIAKNVADFYTQPARWHEFVAQMQQQGQVINFESEMRQRSGEVVWITTTAQSMTNGVGQVLSYEGRIQEMQDKNAIAHRENSRRRLRRLLISLFPKAIAKRFIHDPQNQFAQSFSQVTLLLIAIDSSADLLSQNNPQQIIDSFNHTFQLVETLAAKHGIEHVRSLGTTILVAAGLPTPQDDHADRILRFALDLQQQTRPFPMHMGIHSGPIVAGIVGAEQRLTYELYGETLTFTQHLTQQGIQEKILISATTHQSLTGSYNLKDNTAGTLESYWLQS
jgi:class 3 adenylate cyclase